MVSPSSVAGAHGDTDLVTLANGLRVLFLEAHSNPMVASTVAVLSGVSDESPTTSGASHFLEHLLFNGTTTRTQQQISAETGLSGGYNTASTRGVSTLFQFLVHRDHLDKALDIQSDMLLHSTIPPEVFAKERGIVLEEMGRDESDGAYGAEQFYRRCYFGSGPRAMPVLGTVASIKAMTRDAVAAHYHRLYRPERMVLFLAGDFERDKALALIEKTFGAAAPAAAMSGSAALESAARGTVGSATPARETAVPATAVPATAVGGTAESAIAARETAVPATAAQKPGLYRQHIDGDRGYLHLGIPAPGVGDPDAVAISALAEILGGQPGSRLARALSGEEGSSVISASASYEPGSRLGRLEVSATVPKDSDGLEATAAVRRVFRRLAREPVGAVELRAVVAGKKASILYLRDQVHYLGMALAPNLALGETPSLGPGEGALALLTPALLREAARRWLLAVPVVALSSPSVPEGTDETKPLSLLEAPPEAADDAAGEHATAGAHATGNRAGHAPAQRIDFDNGLTLLVAENPDSQIFAAHLLVRDRAAFEPEGKDGIADLLHRMLPYGSVFLDGEGITAKLGALGARMKTVDDAGIPYDDYYHSPRYSYVRFETIQENWREGMGLLFTTVAHPRLDERDLALALSEQIDLARRGSESPQTSAKALYAQTLLKGGGLSRPIAGTPLALASIRAADLRAFHARYFSPDNLILSIVSNVPVAEVLENVRASFGALPSGPGAPSLAPLMAGEPRVRKSLLGEPPITQAAARVETAVGKKQSQILIGGIFDRDGADLAPLIVASTVLSRRLAKDLRETRGLAYAVGCSVEDFGTRSWFTASMGTAAGNIEIAEAALKGAIRAFGETDPDAREVERALNAMRGQMAMRRMTRISQAYSLGFNELLGRNPTFDAALDAALGAVTPADVRRVAKRYFDPARMVTAIAR